MAKVIIEYEAQAASLKAVTDTIINANKQIGDSAEAAGKEGANAYKAMGKSMSAAFSSQEVTKSLNSNIVNINKNRDALNKLTGDSIKFSKAAMTLGKVVKESAAETLKAKEALAKYQKSLTETGNGTDNTEKKTQSLKSRLAELKNEINRLDAAGEGGSAAFEKLSIEAGQLADQIGDTQERIKVLASDTFKFDAALGAVKGLAAGFAVAQGAAAAFGIESEDLNKTIARTQGAIALLTGLQEIADLVTGQGATKIALQNIFMKEKIVVTNAAAGAVGTLATAEEGAAVATLATKKSLDLLKVAIAGTGIGALVLVLGALYSIYQKNSAASKAFQEALKSGNAELENAKVKIKELKDEQADLNDELLVQSGELKAEDAKKNKIDRQVAKKNIDDTKSLYAQKQIQLDQAYVIRRTIEQEQKRVDELSKSYSDGASASKLAALDRIATLSTELKSIEQLTFKTSDAIKGIKEANAKLGEGQKTLIDEEANKAAIAKAKENAANIKEINDKLIDDRLKAELNGLKRLEVIDGESTQNKIDQAKKEAEIETASAKSSITNAKLRASTIALIDAQLAQNIEQIQLDATNKAIENEIKLIEAKRVAGTATIDDEIALVNKTFSIEKNKLQALIDANKATNAELELLDANRVKKIQDINNKAIQEDYNLRVQAFELRKMLGVTTLADEVSLIRARAEAELKANELSANTDAVKEANRKAIIAKTDAEITQAKASEANKRIDIDNAENQAALTLGTATSAQKIKLIEDEGQKAINLLDKKLLGEEAYNAAVLKINADTTAKLNAEQQARVDAAFEYANAVASVFESINALSKQQSEQRIADIEATSVFQLNAIDASDALERDKIKQREALDKRTKIAVANEKTKQARNDKALALFQATIQVAQQVAANIGNPIIAALIATAGAIQIAAIAGQPLPKFEKGGEVGGKRHSQGGTIVEAEQGEYIVNRKQTTNHRRELNAINQSSDAFKKLINERYVKPALMNYMLSSKSKEVGVNVNATLNSKTMEAELKGLRKDLRNNNIRFSNPIDSRYTWQ